VAEPPEEPQTPPERPRTDAYAQAITALFTWADNHNITSDDIADAYGVKRAYIVAIRNFTKDDNRTFLEWAETFRHAQEPPDVTAAKQWGSYNLAAHSMIEGEYQLIRPAYLSPTAISATYFKIAWSTPARCLTYVQDPFPGTQYAWDVKGNIAFVTHASVYHFVATDTLLGRQQMMTAKYDPDHNSFRGLSLMLTRDHHALCAPVVLIPWDTSHQQRNATIPAGEAFQLYRQHLAACLVYDAVKMGLQIRPFHLPWDGE
jgi:hypothetical protein